MEFKKIDLDELLIVEMKDFILEFCEKIGPRSPCSNNESKAAKLFYNKLKALGYNVKTEEFTVHPGAYKASFRLPMILFILTIIFLALKSSRNMIYQELI